MDVLGKIVQGTGCAVDGTVAAQNPLSRALDNFVQSHVRNVPRPGSVPSYGMRSELQMQMQRSNVQKADEQFLSAFEHEAASRSRIEAAYCSGEMKQQFTSSQQVSMEKAFQEAQRTQFQQKSQLIMGIHTPHSRTMQHEAWVTDFHSYNLHKAWQSADKSNREIVGIQGYAPRPVLRQSLIPTDHNETEQMGISSEQKMQETMKKLEAQQASGHMARIMSQNLDPKFQNSQFLKFMNQVSTGEVQIDEEKNEVISGELKMEGALERAWADTSGVHSDRDLFFDSWKQSSNASTAVMEKAFADAHAQPLEEEVHALGAASTVNLSQAWGDSISKEETMLNSAWGESDKLEAIWNKAMTEAQITDPFEDAWDNSTHHNYTYKAENPYMDLSENFQKGVEFFNSGYLNDAIFAFEAEVQQHPDNSEAWRMLGECHAENDEDKSAIICLERAVEEDPYNLSALLALGVSNVNELNPQGALRTLKAWVQHNPKFHGLKIQVDDYSDGSLMDEVMQLMLQARAHDHSDSDVQVVLGVLYNVSKDYDAAVDSFKAATKLQPNAYALWNKIGATLANSARSLEAIPAYHRALELKPRYARGWLNLGISHANLGEYEKATKCYLQALCLNTRADHIWSYLRICFTCMERFDLVKIADTKDIAHFRQEFKLVDL
ncbi:TPR repeat-containing protein [Plasmopara halstedii]|uniref:TPR repeat-containing protein n=1 Tax=Plasmopara halstedii TaxID=4781 RepID=A0A0N7L567_PLAHL|nr:TPR repeat-containing protein [Plasmopara halstedii]CEG40627.1 TPR repeat-containing protein [Plasmopara halstedii]|eukprot:XP_024576996.1 TPR repeat-containing protein [Plasmopara halstedii]